MKQFKIFSIYAVIFCLISLISCSSDSVTLKIKPAFLDFKEVNLGDFKEIEVSLTNRYDEDLTITDLKINGSTNFTISVGGTTPIDIKINETYNLTVKCEPAAAGLIEGSLVVTHSGTVNPKETKMRGTGVPVAIISLSDTTYDFGKKTYQQSTKSRRYS